MSDKVNLANAVRALSMDAVQAAKCGHPGMPMGMAEIALVLWTKHLKHNPKNPDWFNRDRFVLSNGHGSMLLYSLLHLTGYDLPLEELKNFRKLGSKTPGHPECDVTPGVETTTGPLGQGLANAVGMALAEKILAHKFNKPDHQLVNHHTYVFCGDGDLMEGISHEACSYAGTHKLEKLIVLYDDNDISIDGEVSGWFTDDTAKRFESYGWHVISKVDGHNEAEIDAAIEEAKQSDKPSLICCKTIIGKGSPNKAGTSGVHGAALGEEEVLLTRKNINWNHEPFEIPKEAYEGWNQEDSGKKYESDWLLLVEAYKEKFTEEFETFNRLVKGDLPKELDSVLENLIKEFEADGTSHASRKCSGMCLDALGPILPELVGGSADLSPSNNTEWKGSSVLTPDSGGNYLNYGVREFGMSAIMNGMILHGAIRPYGGTFLTFLDYARNAVRMSALMKLPVIYVYTHDSIGVGEDGPTHQPVEHITMLRATPGVFTWRPCDGVETTYAWQHALKSKINPHALILSRQNLPPQTRNDVGAIAKGGYVLKEADQEDLTIIASGSEVGLAVDAAEILAEDSLSIKVVSIPCTELFDLQSDEYKFEVLGDGPKLAIEAGQADFWHKYLNQGDLVLGMDTYGESAPLEDLLEHFGFTISNVVSKAKELLKK
ncbi:MAG: transketolase [Gammaproteobacteria bacterium]|jgi:transketolase|nr:transketolase [Gammaproteobacteria bacterium]|tara:strand:- start:915 stop:2894 length:1980 start_codon:yes stop_codon:yes gene_type:complete